MKRITHVNESTAVDCPADWARLPFVTLQAMALELDRIRIETSMDLAVLVRYIRDSKRFKDEGHDTFEDWCESLDRSAKWGHALAKAADHAGRVNNPRQARELNGLSDAQADAVVEVAKQAGPLTAPSIAAAREKVVASNRHEAKQIELSDWLKDVCRVAEKLRKVLRREVGTEAAEGFLDQCLEAARGVAG